MRRRFMPAVVAVLVALTTLAVGYRGARGHPAYDAGTTIVFLIPATSKIPNSLTVTTESLIITAGVVQAAMTSGRERAALLALGVPDNYSLDIVNHGDQWANNFDEPVLHLAVQDSSPERASADTQLIVKQLMAELTSMQKGWGVPANSSISALTAPAYPQPVEVGGSPKRAIIGSLVLGTILGAIALRWTQRLSGQRREPILGLNHGDTLPA